MAPTQHNQFRAHRLHAMCWSRLGCCRLTSFLSSNSQGWDTRRRLLDAARISAKDALSSLVCVAQKRSSESGGARSPAAAAAPPAGACAAPSLHNHRGRLERLWYGT